MILRVAILPRLFSPGYMLWVLFFVLFSGPVFADEQVKEESVYAGELFATPVAMSNYYFAKGAIMVFGNKWGPQPQTKEEWEDCIWNDLLLSYEAFRRNVVVSQQELDGEISEVLKAEKVDFDWKTDKAAYSKWVKERIDETAEVFENQLRHLLQLQKLRKEVMDNIHPELKDEEAYQEFLNEHNTLGIELVQFEAQKEADEFYRAARANQKFWEEQKAEKPKEFKRPGFVALEFLMNMWGLPKDAVYKMMQMEIGELYSPVPIYKGYGVFKVLEKRSADKLAYPQLKDSYYEQIKMKKKYEGLNEWVKNLKQEAKIKIYKR